MKIKNRVKSQQDFSKVIKNSKGIRSQDFVLHYVKNDLGYSRVGIAVSNKLGNAVIRNRIKRQIRPIVDSLVDYNKQSLDIILIVKNNFLDKNHAEQVNSIKSVLVNIL